MIAESSIFGILLALIFWICVWSILAWRGLRFIRKGEFPLESSMKRVLSSEEKETKKEVEVTSPALSTSTQEDIPMKIAAPREKGDGCLDCSDEEDWPEVSHSVTVALVHREASDIERNSDQAEEDTGRSISEIYCMMENGLDGGKECESGLDSEHEHASTNILKRNVIQRNFQCKIDLDEILEYETREYSECFSSGSETV